jgi:DNA mismatch repair protein MutL
VSGIIRLLPEHIANQIAAGEVVERPASVVKELLENSIDAGAKSIQLVVEQAGKTLVEVIDNGKGMSPTDARMCFERHATSKINSIDDLFNLRTMGFRGEALASIASVAQVELITRQASDELGTKLILEGGKVHSHESIVCPTGTRMRVKNLFFNIPARRQFLKEDSTELNHILSEFERVALAHPSVKMELISNGNILYSLTPGNYFQRIEGLFGKNLSKHLLFFEEHTDIVKLKGYITEPEHASKRKKNHFFFVNDRFIRSPYFTRAIYDAFQGLIPEGTYPQFFVYMYVDPSKVDVNVHPTKTEVKFRDDKDIYVVLQSAIRRCIGKKALTAELDFNTPSFIQESVYGAVSSLPKAYTPNAGSHHSNQNINISSHPDPKWRELYAIFEKEKTPDLTNELPLNPAALIQNQEKEISIPENFSEIVPLFNKFVMISSAEGIFVIDRQRMHERVLYEEVLEKFQQQKGVAIQQLLIPEEYEPNRKDYPWIKENKELLFRLGFDLQEFGKEHFLIQGIPSGAPTASITEMLDNLVEHLKIQLMDEQNPQQVQMAKSYCKAFSLKNGMPASKEEILFLVQSWLKTQEPAYSPFGKPVFKVPEVQIFEELFRQ